MSFVHGAVLWGSPVEDSATGVREVEIKGFAKVNSPEYGYSVANEYLATQIANRVGGLPVPVGAVVEGESGQPPAWASLAFSTDKPPPIDPQQGIKDIPHDLAGVLVFDVLIANQDRHSGNLRYSHQRKQLYAFDHSHTLLGIDPDAAAHLRATQGDFVIHRSQPHRHCLLDHLEAAQHVLGWAEEISETVTRGFLKRITEEAFRLNIGVSEELSTRVFAFLSHRRENLKALIRDNREEFKSIPDQDWGMV